MHTFSFEFRTDESARRHEKEYHALGAKKSEHFKNIWYFLFDGQCPDHYAASDISDEDVAEMFPEYAERSGLLETLTCQEA